jgi:POT family proton-dependent oligopeptide transporter
VIAFVELAERFSYYGTTVVFTNFIQRPLPKGSTTGRNLSANGSAGALGKGQRASTALTTFNSFWVYVIPLFGAYIADTRWGRFKTIVISVLVAQVGHILLVVSSIPSIISHPDRSLGLFIFALIIMGLGTGGFKANISPLVAEQYRKTHQFIGTLKSGERVIVDPSLTTSRIYM